MSTFDDASLVFIPSGYKTSKAYSVKPIDGSGDLTFTRSNNTATRVNSAGLIERVRTNILLQSNTFSTTWFNSNSTDTGGQIGYDGSSDAWRIDITGAAGYISQSIVNSGVATASIYAKAGTLNFVRFRVTGSVADTLVDIDLTDGSIDTTGAGNINATSTSIGSGWYRITLTFNSTTSAVLIYPIQAAGNFTATSGNILIQAAQLETGDIATQYIPTTTAAVSVGPVANVPRLDYLGSSCPRLLLEPQRTNLALFSEQFDNAAWVKVGTTVTANNAVSPDGYTNADALVENTATNIHDTYQAFVSTSSTAYTFSCYIKPSTRTRAYLRSDTSAGTVRTLFDLTGSGSVVTLNHTSASISLVGNGWYRCTITFTEGTGAAGRLVFVEGAVGTNINYAGNGLTAFWLYGAQLEAGAYATSYIPTLGAAVTRGADDPSKTGISSLIGSEAGTIYVEFSALANDLTERRIALSNGTTANVARIGYTNISNRITAVLFNGTNQCVLTYDGADITQTVKVAFTWAVNDFALFVNGMKRSSDNSGTTFAANTLSQLQFDRGDGGPDPYFGKIDELLLFKSRLSDSQLAELTA